MGVFAAVRGSMCCVLIVVGGCATSAPVSPADQSRADAIVARLTAGLDAPAANARVTASQTVGAYSWPNGQIVLTAGLVNRLDEDELAAAIAHELGHLLGDRVPGGPSALRGGGGADDAEVRADLFATQLLARTGFAPEAMARTLTKVMRAPGQTGPCRARLAKRIALLTPPGAGPAD